MTARDWDELLATMWRAGVWTGRGWWWYVPAATEAGCMHGIAVNHMQAHLFSDRV